MCYGEFNQKDSKVALIEVFLSKLKFSFLLDFKKVGLIYTTLGLKHGNLMMMILHLMEFEFIGITINSKP